MALILLSVFWIWMCPDQAGQTEQWKMNLFEFCPALVQAKSTPLFCATSVMISEVAVALRSTT